MLFLRNGTYIWILQCCRFTNSLNLNFFLNANFLFSTNVLIIVFQTTRYLFKILLTFEFTHGHPQPIVKRASKGPNKIPFALKPASMIPPRPLATPTIAKHIAPKTMTKICTKPHGNLSFTSKPCKISSAKKCFTKLLQIADFFW